MTKPLGQRFPCLNHNIVVTPVPRQAVPRQIGVQKNETQISGTTRYGPGDNTPRETSPTREDVERYERDDMEETREQ